MRWVVPPTLYKQVVSFWRRFVAILPLQEQKDSHGRVHDRLEPDLHVDESLVGIGGELGPIYFRGKMDLGHEGSLCNYQPPKKHDCRLRRRLCVSSYRMILIPSRMNVERESG